MRRIWILSVLAIACSSPQRGAPGSPTPLPRADVSGPWAAVSVAGPPSGGVAWDCVATTSTSGYGCTGGLGAAHRTAAQAAAVSGAASAPLNLASAISGSTVTLTWSPVGSGILSFIVEAGSGAGLLNLANFDTGSAASSLTVTAVPAGTYYVRVRARDASGVSPPSNEIVLTVVAAACTSVPGTPTGLTGSAAGSSVMLQWTAPASGCAPTTYMIEAGSLPALSNLANIATGTTATTFAGAGVGRGTYYLRVRAANQAGASGPSNEITLTVGDPFAFAVDLPVASGDTANNAYGIWPFGVHGSSHAFDGHPGWDVEFRPGASVMAAADGTVSSALREATGDRFTVRIQHAAATGNYATDYTNLASLAAGIAANARVVRGQILGPAGVQSQFIGSTSVTWGMTHFQVNDFSRSEGLTNPNAVSPEPYLTPLSRSLFESIWRTAVYQTEWCEPFFTNSRLATFPVARTWTPRGSGPIAAIEARCLSATTNEMAYSLRGGDGAVIESGTLSVDAAKKPLATVDFVSSSGPSRLGVWDVLSETMQLNLSAPGAPRPASLSGAAVYIPR